MQTIPRKNKRALNYTELLTVVKQSYDGILVIDNQSNVVFVNESYFRITGLAKNVFLSSSFQDFFAKQSFPKAACLEALKTGKPYTCTHYDVFPGRTIMVTSQPIFDRNKQVKLIVSNCRDMTEMVELEAKLERAREIEALFYQNQKKCQGAPPLAVSGKMQSLFTNVHKISTVDITVLITGESGVGKEVLARYIHDNSPRRHQPFVAVNCGAVPEHLLESEFFGYAPGSFTGASKTGKRGLFETAEKGTLFLDEIGDLPLNLQVKLLRALDQSEFTRVGDTVPTPFNVRILAATNQNIKEAVCQQKFRQDLYYRLNTITLSIPPLRERPEDIRPLCFYFLHEFNVKYGLKKKLSPHTLSLLENYSWPGNVRQLRNTIERMIVMSRGDCLQLHLSEEGDFTTALEPSLKEAYSLQIPLSATIPEAVEQIERFLLSQALQTSQSSRKIALVTGIDQTTVLRKLKKYGLLNTVTPE